MELVYGPMSMEVVFVYSMLERRGDEDGLIVGYRRILKGRVNREREGHPC